MQDTITLGISPCPNDTYIFHALLHGLVPVPFNIKYILADVEELNARAVAGELMATKLSVGVLPKVLPRYAVLRSGAALGFGCGPLLIAREPLSPEAQATASIAIPGRMTTANLLLQLHGHFQGQREEMIFDKVMPHVLEGKAHMGLIIHEGRFTYADQGLHKIMDLGEWWEEAFQMPLPLGAITVRRDVPKETALALEKAIAQSIAYARAHPEASANFIRAHAQELSEEVTAAHIATFVNDYSVDLGTLGQKAIELLVNKAVPRQDIPLFLEH